MEDLQQSPFLAGVLLLNQHLREGRCAAACVCHHWLWHRQHCLHCGVGKSCFCSAGEGTVRGIRTEWRPVVGVRLHVSRLGRLFNHTIQLTDAQGGGKASALPRSQPVCISSLISPVQLDSEGIFLPQSLQGPKLQPAGERCLLH